LDHFENKFHQFRMEILGDQALERLLTILTRFHVERKLTHTTSFRIYILCGVNELFINISGYVRVYQRDIHILTTQKFMS
jgi:hypothetical protein